MTKAIALFSGGLDSILAAILVQKQNIEVTGLTFTTPFFGADKAKVSAAGIDLPLLIQDITDEHLQMLKAPRYGYGKNMNPCIDCHTLMLSVAGRKMEETGADFIVTGEVLGQRPMSQTKQSLSIVAKNSGFADDILRPLSAQLLEPIRAQREGIIDTARLAGISGRGRKEQIRMAEAFGIPQFPPPAGGCLLTDPMFARRLRELLDRREDRQIRDYDLLRYGRHFRDEHGIKIIVGRNHKDNEALLRLTLEVDFACAMARYPGPYVLVPYGNPAARAFAAALCVRYSDAPDGEAADVICRSGGDALTLVSRAAPREECEKRIL
ncbi:MAG: tRNA 4-thiouridine(8) synthase ThiI [Smithellaceae bacterium]|nr:tRNA 4-thiouridine(8) synthase ThiI [Syntrophaceae bacterium]MDD4242298.1 tRNA 4-thiouridine(8) synthase ThiI [Smithellaceae bacterium]NLX51915.1 tRNA 4-thiouridine(8) synthase ThiI [Deltaproteobacteria bacterium]